MSKTKKYYTYGLANPLKPSKETYIGGDSLYEYEFFYFGYTGSENRLDEHLECKNSDKNRHKKNTIKKIQRNGSGVIFIKILEDVDKQTAIKKEIEMISYYGRYDLGLGPLTNMTDGGDGGDTISKHPNRKEIIEKISKANKGKKNGMYGCDRSGENAPMLGKSHTEVAKKKMSVARKGKMTHSLGKKWYTNNIEQNLYFEDEQPEGWVLGKLPMTEENKKKISLSKMGENHQYYDKKYYNNGLEEGHFYPDEQPSGWAEGRKEIEKLKGKNNPMFGSCRSGELNPMYGKKHPNRTRKWYNNGSIQKFFELDTQPNGWILGRLKTKIEGI